MNLTPVAQWLEKRGLGTIGETIFMYHLPADVDVGILLRPSLNGAKIWHDLPGYLKFDFQLIVRARTVDEAQALSEQAVKELTVSNLTVGDWAVNYMRPVHHPVGFPISIGEMVEFNTRIACCIVVL